LDQQAGDHLPSQGQSWKIAHGSGEEKRAAKGHVGDDAEIFGQQA